MKIDAHQHFWNFDPVRDSWITPEMSIIQKDFLPDDLLKELQAAGICGSVAVQASQSEIENDFLLSLASQNDFIKGVVGWINLQADDIDERLSFYAGKKKVKGFRHILQSEPDRALMLQPSFTNGISKLHIHNFTYDLLIYPDQLKYATQLIKKFPEQKFVIDHLAKPAIKLHEIDSWKRDITEISTCKNVWCKVSGMITEADWEHWLPQDLKPYLDVIFEIFGAQKLMFGSDYPVCLVAGNYQQWVSVVKDFTDDLSANEQSLFWGENAISFYNLEM